MRLSQRDNHLGGLFKLLMCDNGRYASTISEENGKGNKIPAVHQNLFERPLSKKMWMAGNE